MNKEVCIFDGVEFIATKNRMRRTLIDYINLKYGSINKLLPETFCKFSGKPSLVKLNIDYTKGIANVEYAAAPYYCGSNTCKCKTLNRLSYEFLVDCRGMSKEDAKQYLVDKNKKSLQTALASPNTKNPFAMAILGKNPMSYKVLTETHSLEDAKKILEKRSIKSIKTKRDNGWFDDIGNNPYSKEFWKRKGLTDEEAQEKVNSRNFFVTKTLPNPSTIDFWILKHGVDEGTRLYNDILANKKWKSSYDYLLTIYDEETANKIMSDRMLPAHTAASQISVSTASSNFFRSVYKIVRRMGISRNDIQTGSKRTGTGEFLIVFDNKHYRYDFTIHSIKVIIEYNGSIWHPRSDRMTTEKFEQWKLPKGNSSITAFEKQKLDLKKLEIAKNHGYNILEVWDTESKQTNLNSVIEFIKAIYENQKN